MTAHSKIPTLEETEATVSMLIASTAGDIASVIAAKARFLEMHAVDAKLDAALVQSGVAAYLARQANAFFANCLTNRPDVGEIAMAMMLAGNGRKQIVAAFAAAKRTPAAAEYAIASAHSRAAA